MLLWMFEAFGGLLGLALDILIPLGVFVFLGGVFFRVFQSLFEAGSKAAGRRTGSSSYRTSYRTSNVKSSRTAAIDRVLAEYFKRGVSLILFDDVSISTRNGSYTTVDDLYVNYKGEKICTLSEFKREYPASYDKVIDALAQLAQQGGKVEEEKAEEKKKKEEKKATLTPAEKFIDQINSLNKDIENEEITNGLYQTCDFLKRIDIVDREDGKVDQKLNKLYEYYVPLLIGILKEYKRLSGSTADTEEFKKTEVQLIKTIKLINEALKTIYNSLHESDYMNLNADINTLQSLLKQDGLVDEPFKAGKK